MMCGRVGDGVQNEGELVGGKFGWYFFYSSCNRMG